MLRSFALFAITTTFTLVACAPGADTPAALREGRTVYGDRCSSCHGNTGKGGIGPALTNVRETWPSCDEHKEWIALGSDGWKREHGNTYGAKEAPITGRMPGHADTLTPDEIASVAAFQRVEYGGGDAQRELEACGVATP